MSMGDCNVEDILCQMETLRHLRGLKKEIGSDAFLAKFPELTGIEAKLETEIKSQQGNLRDALTHCDSGIEDFIGEDALLDDDTGEV